MVLLVSLYQSLNQRGRAQRRAHVFEMLLQRYCWETFKLAVYFRWFVGFTRLYVFPFVVLYLVWFKFVGSIMANGTRLLVHASERALPPVTRSSRVKVTYLHCHKYVSHPDWRGQSTLCTNNTNDVIRSFNQYQLQINSESYECKRLSSFIRISWYMW